MSIQLTRLEGEGRHVVLFVLGSLALLVAFWLLVYMPSKAELTQLRAEIAGIKDSLGAAEAVQHQHGATMSSYREARHQAGNLLSKFPREDDLPEIMEAFDKVARSQGARIETTDYSAVKWDPVLGRVQVTAMLRGGYPAIGATAINIARVLPSARLEQMRVNARQAAEAKGQNAATDLRVDYLEAEMVFSILLVASRGTERTDGADDNQPPRGDPRLVQLLENQGSWYPRPAGGTSLGTYDLFRPSAKAREMIALLQTLERYQKARVSGIAQSGARQIATVNFEGRTYRLQPGDQLVQARVSSVSRDGVTLSIAGRTLMLRLGE
ncbi:MAG: hypothetical protein ACOX4G_07020 [Limnochordia bacterium]